MYIGKIDTGKSYKKVIVGFILISAVLIAIVFYASVSHALIVIHPVEEKISTDFEIGIKRELTAEATPVPSQNLQGKIITVEKEGEKKIASLPEKEVDEQPKGKVAIYNKRSESQPLLANSQLRAESNGKIYRTDEAVNVPAGGQVEVGITSVDKGKGAETEPTKFTFIKLWEGLADTVYAENKEAITGGTANRHVATAEFMDKQKEDLSKDLYLEARNEIITALAEGEKLQDSAIKTEILESKTSVEPDSATDSFTVNMRIKATAVLFNEQDLFNIANQKLNDKVSGGKVLAYALDNSFRYEILSINEEEGTATLKVHLEGIATPKISSDIFNKDKLLGRTPEETKKYFQQFPEIQSIDISLSPFWVNSIPALKDHIEITVEQ